MNDIASAIWSGLIATSPAEAVSVALGLTYAALAIRKSRWCWVAGGVGSAIACYLSLVARPPMQAARPHSRHEQDNQESLI